MEMPEGLDIVIVVMIKLYGVSHAQWLQSNVSEMIDTVKVAFNERLDKNEWLDSTTRNVSKEKVDAITKMVAFPDQLFNDTYLNDLYADVSCSLHKELSTTWLQTSIGRYGD